MKRTIHPYTVFLVCIAAIAIAGISFYSGVSYQKGHQKLATTTRPTIPSRMGGFGSRGGRVIGQVTAVSATTISVQNARTGTITTSAITSATQISSNGQTATASDIHVGDTVFISEDTSNTSQAAQIMVNPNFGGASGAGSTQAPTAAPGMSLN